MVQAPYQNTSTNTFGYQSMPGTDPNQVVSDYQNYKIDLDPGAEQRRQLREEATNNKWNSAFAGGIPTQLRMALQGEEQRGNQQVADFDRQSAQYAQNGMELARKQSLLPQLVQTGGTSSGYNSQVIQKPSIWSSIIGAAGQIGMGAAMHSDPRLKDIKGKSEEGLDANKRLHPIVYKYKQGTGLDQETHHGFNAKEVEGVKPEAVSRVQMHNEPDADDMGGVPDGDTDDQGMRAVHLERLVAMHTNAINELSDKIDKVHGKRPKIRRTA